MRRRQQSSSSDDPASWPVSRLLNYLRENSVAIPDPPLERSVLVRLVKDHKDDELLKNSGQGSNSDDNEEPAPSPNLETVDPATTPPEALAQHLSTQSYVGYLRCNPSYLTEVLNRSWAAFPLRSDAYPPVSKWLRDVLNSDDQGAALMSALTATGGNAAVCGKHLTRNDVCFKCLDCGADPTCIICAECFKTSPCQNHNYRMIRSGGGMCDCGDATAWKPESFCTKHRGLTEADDPTTSIPADAAAWIYPCLRASLRLATQIMHRYVTRREEANKKQWRGMARRHVELVGTIAQQLIALTKHSDCGRRVVAKLLCEPFSKNGQIALDGGDTSDGAPTTLEILFLIDARVVNKKSCAEWWPPFADLITQCVADPFFKIPMCRVLLKHREYCLLQSIRSADEEGEEHSLASLGVQVYTVPTVVEPLLNPKRLALGDNVTVLDRLIASVIYGLVALRDADKKHFPLVEYETIDAEQAPVIKIAPTTEDERVYAVVHALVELKYTLKACAAARAFFGMSVLLNNAMATIAQVVSNSSWVRRDPDARGNILAWHLEGRLSSLLALLHRCWRGYMKRMGAASSGDHVGGAALQDQLSAPLTMFQNLKHKELHPPAQPQPGADDAHRPLPHLEVLHPMLRGLAVQPSQPGSMATATTPLALVEQLLDVYIPAATRFAHDVVPNVRNATDLFEPQCDPMTFTFPSLRLVASVLRLALEGSSGVRSSSVLPVDISTVAFAALLTSRMSLDTMLSWATVLSLPQLVVRQAQQGLWKRDFMKVSHHIDLYNRLWQGYTKESDVSLIQMLAAAMPPTPLVNKLFNMYAYTPPATWLDKKLLPVGYTGFLHTILTVVFDHSKIGAKHLASHNADYLEHTLRLILCRGGSGLQRSAIQHYLKNMYCYDEEDGEEEAAGGELSEASVSRCLAAIAVADQRKDGTVYKLKNLQQYASINPYTCHLASEAARKEFWNEFCMAAARTKLSDTAVLDAAPGLAMDDRFPQHAALKRPLRQLLHSEAVLNTAAFTTVCAALHADVNIPNVHDEDVCTALDVLHAVVVDYHCITAEHTEAINVGSDGAAPIRWDVVEAVLKVAAFSDTSDSQQQAETEAQQPPSPNASEAECKFPLPQLTVGLTVQQKVTVQLDECNLSVLGRSPKQSLGKAITLRDALLVVYRWLKAPVKTATATPIDGLRKERRVILLHKVTAILAAVDALPLEETDTEAKQDGTAQPDQLNEKALRAKQRQRELMEKMKARQKKAMSSLEASAAAASSTPQPTCSGSEQTEAGGLSASPATAATTEGGDNVAASALKEASCTMLHAKCLVDATELECCFCQSNDDDDEPLCYLAHVSSSPILRDLGYLPPQGEDDEAAPQRPWLSANIQLCGHAAHPRCVHRQFQHLASMRIADMRQLLLARRGYRGMAYLGASEFACPLCFRTCTALSCVPHLRDVGKGEDQAESTTAAVGGMDAFFGDMVLCNAHQSATTLSEFAQSLVHGAIGFSANTDDDALYDIAPLAASFGGSEAAAQEFVLTHAFSDILRQEVLLIRSGRALKFARYQSLLSVAVSLSANMARGESAKCSTPREPLAALVHAVLESRHLSEGSAATYVVSVLRGLMPGVACEAPDALASLTVLLSAQPDGGIDDAVSPAIAAATVTLWEHAAAALILSRVVNSGNIRCALDPADGALDPADGAQAPTSSTTELLQDVLLHMHTLDGMRTAIRKMLHDILPNHSLDDIFRRAIDAWHSDDATAPSGRMLHRQLSVLTNAQRIVRCATSAEAVRATIAEHILHLPVRYNQLITQLTDVDSKCVNCDRANPAKPVVCLGCGRLMCLQNTNAPELYKHARECGGGSVFLIVRATSFLIIQCVVGRAAQTPSVYVDKFGERDESMTRGAALTLSTVHLQEFIWLWLSWGWDADSAVLAHAWRHNLDAL